jgi:endonuclease III
MIGRRERAVAAALALEAAHCTPDLGNHADPLAELVFISLTRQTHAKNAARTWAALRGRFTSWEELAAASEEEIAETIADGGFARQKAHWIKESLRLIGNQGALSLDFLTEADDEEAEAFLRALPGTSIKSARCVLMYSLGRDVLPVDTHVRRLSERLGLVAPGLSERRIHDELDDVVAPQLRYSFHVNAVAHGRSVCTALRPRCGRCVIADLCPSAGTA